MNLPNKLSLTRIFMIPVFAVFYFLPYAFAPYAAVGVFILAAFTDFLDGYIARKYKMVTDLGKLLDPIADKILVTAALFFVTATNVTSSYIFSETVSQIFLGVCGTVIIARELLISAVRMIAAAKGTVIQANVFGKIKTVMQDVSLPALIILKAAAIDTALSQSFYGVIWWIAVITFSIATLLTILSGVIYLVENRCVFKENGKAA